MKLPDWRTLKYSIWRSCERVGIRPPDVGPAWDDCDVVTQAELLSYEQVRSIEEAEEKAALAGAKL